MKNGGGGTTNALLAMSEFVHCCSIANDVQFAIRQKLPVLVKWEDHTKVPPLVLYHGTQGMCFQWQNVYILPLRKHSGMTPVSLTGKHET